MHQRCLYIGHFVGFVNIWKLVFFCFYTMYRPLHGNCSIALLQGKITFFMKWDVTSIFLFTSFYTYLPTKTLAKWINLPCKGAVPQLSWRGLSIIQSSKLQKKENQEGNISDCCIWFHIKRLGVFLSLG